MMPPVNPFLFSFALAVAAFLFFRRHRRPTRPLPPGPKKLPLVGNILQIFDGFDSESCARWGEKYHSDIIHLKIPGSSMIILNSHEAANDLLEKRSVIYSDRPRLPMLVELMGWGWIFSLMPYGEPWKERRRLFAQHFHPSDVSMYQPRELLYARRLLHRLLESPDDFMNHIRHSVGATTLSLAYGINILPSNDPHIEIAEMAISGLSAAGVPGAFLVNSVPILKYLPDWMPGASFKAQAKVWREWGRKLLEVPFARAQDGMDSGLAAPSFVSACLRDLDETKDRLHQQQVMKETAGAFFTGGADTIVSSLNTFILAMICYPAAQAKAQREVDTILQGRLPEFSDEDSLPYVSAVVKEVLRWQPITPFGIPHVLSTDDVYGKYHIPAGSIVFANIWAMLRNRSDYSDPSSFTPERFLKDGKLNPEVRDPAEAAFGFGRRICPGSHIAQSTLWITAVSILSMFNLDKAVDKDGAVTEPSRKYATGLVNHPLPFKCSIQPRSKQAEELILANSD